MAREVGTLAVVDVVDSARDVVLGPTVLGAAAASPDRAILGDEAGFAEAPRAPISELLHRYVGIEGADRNDNMDMGCADVEGSKAPASDTAVVADGPFD